MESYLCVDTSVIVVTCGRHTLAHSHSPKGALKAYFCVDAGVGVTASILLGIATALKGH